MIIGTLGSYCEPNATEACFPFIVFQLILNLIEVCRKFQAVIHDFLITWGPIGIGKEEKHKPSGRRVLTFMSKNDY